MKANEAPEKIYIPRLEGNKSFVHEWSATKFRKYFNREVAENIEYTRTDAFIEKACEFLNKVTQGYAIRELLTGENYEGKIVEDFKNYMKGE